MPTKRGVKEKREVVVVFRMRPTMHAGLLELADAHDYSMSRTIQKLLEPAIDEELELLREQTSMRAKGLRQRTHEAKLRLAHRVKNEHHQSRLGAG